MWMSFKSHSLQGVLCTYVLKHLIFGEVFAILKVKKSHNALKFKQFWLKFHTSSYPYSHSLGVW